MTKTEAYRLWIIIILFITSCVKEKEFNSSDWTLTFSDEFSDSLLNLNVWTAGLPWGQNIIGIDDQLFIDSAFTLQNGILKIELKRDTVIGNVWHGEVAKPHQFYYTGGLLHTRETFNQQYEYFEVKSRTPAGKGLWSAFWIGPYHAWETEIDVYEAGGKWPDQFTMTYHFRDVDGKHHQNSFTFHGPDLSDEFHTYGVEWNPRNITWFFDGREIFSTGASITGLNMFVILSLSIGGTVPGAPSENIILPAYHEIDYVRVYKKKQSP